MANQSKAFTRALLASSALIAMATAAQAGGFAVREQSAEFQGMSFAGAAAAGGGLSGMFWNPAVAAFAPAGLYSEMHASGVIADSVINAGAGTDPILLARGTSSGQIGHNAIVPASYMSYRISSDLVFAMGVNAPFGFTTNPTNGTWAGQTFARKSEIVTYNFNPTVAYKINNWLSVGAGMQIEFVNARLERALLTSAGSPSVTVEGRDVSVGWTAGVNINPMAGTHVGLGYRGSINHDLGGTAFVDGNRFGINPAFITAETTLPEIVTLSLRQSLAPQWTLLGTAEWTRWSRLKSLDVKCSEAQGPTALCPGGAGALVSSLPLKWHDGQFYSLGLEYAAMPNLTLRTGLALEKSPIQNASERSLRVPDADRTWASIGATYKFNEKMAFDLAYSHIWVDSAPIDRTEGGNRFVGKADTSVDIISASMKIKLGHDGAPAAAPMK